MAFSRFCYAFTKIHAAHPLPAFHNNQTAHPLSPCSSFSNHKLFQRHYIIVHATETRCAFKGIQGLHVLRACKHRTPANKTHQGHMVPTAGSFLPFGLPLPFALQHLRNNTTQAAHPSMMFLQMSALYRRCSTNDCAARTAMPRGRSAMLDLRLASRLLTGTAGKIGRPRATCNRQDGNPHNKICQGNSPSLRRNPMPSAFQTSSSGAHLVMGTRGCSYGYFHPSGSQLPSSCSSDPQLLGSAVKCSILRHCHTRTCPCSCAIGTCV